MFISLPQTIEAQVLGKQVLRSGTSLERIIAKHVEDAARLSLSLNASESLRELEKSAFWLELLVDSGIVASDKLSCLPQECVELIAIFVTIINRAKDK
jgi:four helix bundle protein